MTPASGRILGAHQKIDRRARKHLAGLLSSDAIFPTTRRILHFEGQNGPDAIKRKSPAKDEPWHYFNPFDESDTMLIGLIQAHYDNLTDALRRDDEVVAAFEAAWLAHAVVDGLTPAHHYPYEEKLVKLRGGLGLDTRLTLKDKLVLPGDTRRQAVSNNWKMWGPKGLFTTHYAFEWGVSTLLLARTPVAASRPNDKELQEMLSLPLGDYFRRAAKEIAALGLYDRFYRTGWTVQLAREIRRHLIPAIIKSVTMVWHKAALEAQSGQTKAVKEPSV